MSLEPEVMTTANADNEQERDRDRVGNTLREKRYLRNKTVYTVDTPNNVF